MWLFVIAGAVAVDAFATGMWLGKKWGASSVATTVGADLAAVEAKVAPVAGAVASTVSVVEADVAALRAKVTPAAQAPLAAPAPIPAALAAQVATAPK